MTFAVVDDNREFARELKIRLNNICQKLDYAIKIDTFIDAESILVDDKFAEYDAIFLDIDMPEVNGIEVTEIISKIQGDKALPYIVFVTSMDHLVFEALKKYPFSFIRKSQLDDIDDCVMRLCKKLSESPSLPVKFGRDIKSIRISDIIRLEKLNNYIIYYTVTGTITERAVISEKHAELMPYMFIRPHIGALVNPEHIIDYKNDTVTMSDGYILSISRSYRKEFKENFHKWLRR